jgi:hypothetical protein
MVLPKKEETKPKQIKVSVKGGFWQKAERKEAKWNAFARRVQARERGIEDIAAKYLKGQVDRVVKNIKKAPVLAHIDRWNVVDKETESAKFVDASIRWYIDSFTKAVRSGLASGKGEISDGEEKAWIFKPEYEAMLHDMVVKSGTKIAESTMEEVLDLLQTAEEESWTVDEFANAIRSQLEDRSPMRARRIARTEAGKVENYGELEGYKETEFVEYKGWLCSFVELSRQAHKDADAQYSDDPIPLDEDFIVDGEALSCPLDPKGSASNVVNCLCSIFPQVKEL